MKGLQLLLIFAVLWECDTVPRRPHLGVAPKPDTCKIRNCDDVDRLMISGKPVVEWENQGAGKIMPAPIPGMRGELTGDGFVDVRDAALLAQFYTGRASLDTSTIVNANVNCDGVYSLKDVFDMVDWLNSKGIGDGNGEPDSMPCYP